MQNDELLKQLARTYKEEIESTTKHFWGPKILKILIFHLRVFAGARYLHGINCSFSNSSPYFTLESVSKLALPSQFALSTGTQMTTGQDGALSQSGTGGALAGRGPRRRPRGRSLAIGAAASRQAESLRSDRSGRFLCHCYFFVNETLAESVTGR